MKKIKTIVLSLGAILILFVYFRITFSSTPSTPQEDVVKIKKTSPTHSTSNEPVQIIPISGWTYDHKEVRPDSTFTYWYVPSDYTKETELFKISDLNVGYRLKADAIIEFQDNVDREKFTAVRHEAATNLKYVSDSRGEFKTLYPETELQKLATSSEAFRFRPIGQNPMTGLKVSKVE